MGGEYAKMGMYMILSVVLGVILALLVQTQGPQFSPAQPMMMMPVGSQPAVSQVAEA